MGELTGATFILFLIFAAVLVVIYLVIRRNLAPAGIVTLVGTVANVIVVALISAASENNPLQVIFVGLSVGIVFSLASAAMAAYFRGVEMGPGVYADNPGASEPGAALEAKADEVDEA
ncbi:MAG: hypothetical protein JXB47_11680 [Anaerolineae bacterium]|nr:hypothetical protein [Anaerolineae bacterium]